MDNTSRPTASGTSIDLGSLDSLVSTHDIEDDFASPGVSSFLAMGGLLDSQRLRQAARSNTISIPSPVDLSFPVPSYESSSVALSSNSILCNSPVMSELDFTGVHYVESTTPTKPAEVRPQPSRQSSARSSRLMDLEELNQLRDCLVKGSSAESQASHRVGSSGRFTLGPVGGEEKQEEDVSFIAQLPPPQLSRMPSYTPAHLANPNFIDVTGRASTAPSDMSMLSSTRTLPDELYAVAPMPIPTLRRTTTTDQQATLSASCSKPASIQMPRESVAVLIDAVRSSSLQEDDKCRFVFDLFDVTKRGIVSREGVAAFVEATLLANNLNCYGDFQVHEMVDKLFAKSTSQHEMTYEEFRRVFLHAVIKPSATPHSSAKETASDVKPTSTKVRVEPPEYRPSVHFRAAHVGAKKKNFWQRTVVKTYSKYDAEIHWLSFYAAAMVAAFAVKASSVAYDPAAGYAPRAAKGFAQVIMVDAFFLLLPMCRNFVTYLRRFTAITSRVPVDKHIEFHKICGVVMLVASLGHTVAWFVIVFHVRSVPHDVWTESRFAHLTFIREEDPLKLIQRLPMWTGFAMALIAAVAAPLTLSKVRRGNFNAFWMTHLLFVPFLVLILIHGLAMWVQPPQAFLWVLPPLVLYFVEKRYRMTNMFGGQTSILRVHFSQDTVAIFMKKPANFHFHPGMYLFLNVPVVSRFEWHPFTISSAPEDDCLSVHIRKAGDWTGALHKVLKAIKDTRHDPAGLDLESDVPENQTPYPSVFIDGPIGAPSQDYYRYKSVVFVGAGIGVTPFASILRSVVHQWEAFRCPCCNSVTFPRKFQIQKIYFYWITREQEALTWFTETMNQLTELDTEGRLEIHNYFSPLKRESVVAPLRALQTFIHDAEGQDIISGLTTKQVTHFGRPDWKDELERIAQEQRQRADHERRREHEERQQAESSDERTARFTRVDGKALSPPNEEVAIFFCGPKTMGSAIHDECATFNQQARGDGAGVVYDFRSESF